MVAYGAGGSVPRSFRVPLSIWRAFERRCKAEGVKPSVQVRHLITQWAIDDDENWTP
jgi:hypothetical protein